MYAMMIVTLLFLKGIGAALALKAITTVGGRFLLVLCLDHLHLWGSTNLASTFWSEPLS